MVKVHIAKETSVRVPNRIGVLEGMAKLVAETGINVLGVTAWVEDDRAVFRLVTDDDVRVADTLRAEGFVPSQANVLVAELPHKPGMLHWLADALAQEGVDIHHLYATGAGHQDRCLVVFSTADNDRARVLLKASSPDAS